MKRWKLAWVSNAGDGPDRRGVLVAAVMLCGFWLEGAVKMQIRGCETRDGQWMKTLRLKLKLEDEVKEE